MEFINATTILNRDTESKLLYSVHKEGQQQWRVRLLSTNPFSTVPFHPFHLPGNETIARVSIRVHFINFTPSRLFINA